MTDFYFAEGDWVQPHIVAWRPGMDDSAPFRFTYMKFTFDGIKFLFPTLFLKERYDGDAPTFEYLRDVLIHEINHWGHYQGAENDGDAEILAASNRDTMIEHWKKLKEVAAWWGTDHDRSWNAMRTTLQR